MRIEVQNNKCRVVCGPRIAIDLDKAFAIRVPGAFYAPSFRQGAWDGKKHFVTDAGYFKTGLLPQVVKFLKDSFPNEPLKLVDIRDAELDFYKAENLKSIKLRDYQQDSVNSIVNNYVENLYFPRGIVSASTNAGKTFIAVGIFKAFKKTPTLLLINNRTLFDQFMEELPVLLGDDFGYVRAKDEKWGKFTMAMVPTLVSRIHKYDSKLARIENVIVDECHLTTSASYNKVLTKLYNSVVRVGLSGSALDHKDKVKNQTVREFFGDVIYNISSKEIEKRGYSSPITVRILKGSTKPEIFGDYALEYERGIIKNTTRNKSIWKKVKFLASKERLPLMIVVKNHSHITELLRLCPKELKNDYVVNFIHHKVKAREAILRDFKEGNVDILISSMIIKIGQNMPLMKAMINAGGGDSVINTLQLLGRAKRKHESKKKTYYYDFFDQGYYLRRHSRHRIAVFKREGHKLVETYKK